MPWLLVNPGSPEAWKIQLKPGTNTLGRSSGNDFALDDASVSSSHCQIVVESGKAVLKDLGSTNGTFLGHVRVEVAPLQPGQTFHLGTLRLIFCADEPDISASAQLRSGVLAERHHPKSTPSAVSSRTAATVECAAPLPPVVVSAAPDAPETQCCKYHPKTPARFQCPQCRHLFCELCVHARAQHNVCRACGVECVPVQVQIKLAPPPKGFYARLPGAFVFPFRGSGVLVLIVGTILLALLKAGGGMGSFGIRGGPGPGFRGGLSFGWWGLMARAIILGYLFTYMQNIIHSTAIDDKELPSLPDITNFWEDILLPCLQLIGVTLISFAPAIGVECWVIFSEAEGAGPMLTSALILGCLYFPMAFLALAMLDSVAAANPLQVIPSILRVPREYLVAVVALGMVFGTRALGDYAIVALFPKGLATHSIPNLLAMFAVQSFWGLASLYMLTVGMRILGLLYVTRKDQLGWYSH